MKSIGTFNIHDYMQKLYEAQEEGGPTGDAAEGLIIPAENKKHYDWLKKEYEKGKTEVKVEIRMGGSDFKPGYELQTDLKSVKEFKPSMTGGEKTSKTPVPTPDKKEDGKEEKEGKKAKAGMMVKVKGVKTQKKEE